MQQAGMFYSAVIPGILHSRDKRETSLEIQSRESVYSGMTVEKPAEPQEQPGETALALSMLYEQFRRPIHSYIYRLLGNQEDADDVTQEVFVRACTSWHSLQERDHLSPWLYRIATNLCVDILRRRKRISWWPLSHRRQEESGEDAFPDDTSYLLADSGGIPEIAEREHIRQALKLLPIEYATALVLSASQGIPYQEIATIIGTTPNAAATRISRAKKMFAEQYQRISQDGAGKQE
jgi:RNA polymerase sigma-70 factor (ECF subfamily)